jgi:cytidyltransferase-like protein
MMRRIVVSGGFDPIHIGHIRYMEEARKLGDYLTVIVNGDSFLMRKKGYVFMPAEERLEIVLALKAVDFAFIFDSEKDDVVDALSLMDFDVFAKGGDRTGRENIPEWGYCVSRGKKIVTNIGGGKVQSSSILCANKGAASGGTGSVG